MQDQLSNSPQRKNDVLALVSFVVLVMFAALSIQQQHPPSALGNDAPAPDFSAARALRQIQPIARQSHPIGSAQHDEVRDVILHELGAAGLVPEIQSTTSVSPVGSEAAVGANVQNIVARLPGTSNTKAVILVGHYDSVPNSLGAADDGAAVGTMLETLRALKSSAPLKNDTIFLFTDGEEVGLLGATAFATEHPWAKDAGLVLNFEARGSSGPSLMFETSDGNGWLIDQFAKAAPYPVATSLLYDIYRVLPNDTDLTPFKKGGMAGMNFAFIDDEVNYHSPNDRIETLDGRSLQHHGSYALALTRHFGNLGWENRKERNAVYFNLFGTQLVHYSQAWVLPLAVATLVLFVFVIITGLKRKRLTFWGIVAGALFFLLTIIAVGITLTVLWWLIGKLHPDYDAQLTGAIHGSGLYMIGFAALTVALTCLLYAWYMKKVAVENLFAGALFWELLLCLLTGLLLPGTSFLFTWPLMFVLLGWGYVLMAKDQAVGKKTLILGVFALPAVLVLVPAIHLIFVALTISLPGVSAIVILLLLGLLIPLLCQIVASHKWLFTGITALVGVGFLIWGGSVGARAANPKPDNLFYCLNAETGQALWASNDARPDAWTSNFFTAGTERGALSEFLPQSSRTFLKNKAPVAPLDAPRAELIADQKNNGSRTLQLRLTSPRHANAISIFFGPEAGIVKASINDKSALARTSADPKQGFYIYFYAIRPEGVTLTLETSSTAPLSARVIDLSYGLPTIPNTILSKRPSDLIPSIYFVSDATLVSKAFTF